MQRGDKEDPNVTVMAVAYEEMLGQKLSALDRISTMSNNLLSECRYLIDQS